MRKLYWILAGVGVGALILAGCDKPAANGKSQTPAPAATVSIPASLFASEAPADARNVADLKKSAESGQEIVVAGRIGGSVAPFVDGRAVFTLADSNMKACDEMKMSDACKTPWDYCCEPRENIVANTMTIQVVDGEGRPLKASLNGHDKLAPGARVIVKGKVAQKQDQTLVVNADSIYVKG